MRILVTDSVFLSLSDSATTISIIDVMGVEITFRYVDNTQGHKQHCRFYIGLQK